MPTDQHQPLPLPADEPMTPARPGMEPTGTDGRMAYWPDGVSTYTVAFHGERQQQIVDEADTAVLAMDAIQTGGVSPKLMWEGLRDIRRLKNRLAAIEQELLLMAREPVDGRPTISWRELGEAMGRDHTTVKELHDRVAAGGTHSFRRWLTENTPRADNYPNA